MSDKAPRTIRIKWVRSGIGFTYRQKRIVRSLGLRKLNQEVERPDTPQIRGLVAKVPHLVEIVEPASKAAWTAVPEYIICPPEAALSKPAETVPALEETEKAEARISPAPAPPPSRGEESGVKAAGEVTTAPAAGANEPQPVEAATAAEFATETPRQPAATEPSASVDPGAKESAPAGEKAGGEEGQPKA